MSQRHHRMNPAGAPRWQPARDDCDDQQHQRHADEGCHIDLAARNEVERDDERAEPAGERAKTDDDKALSDELEHHPPRRRAQREPHADLGGPVRYGVGDDGVDADRDKREQQRPEHAEHARRNAPKNQIVLDVIRERSHIVEGQVGVELSDRAPHVRCDARFGSRSCAHVDLAPVDGRSRYEK